MGSELPNLDREFVEQIDRTVKVQFDGRQYFMKFPAEVTEYLKINKQSSCRIIVPIDPPGETILKFTQNKKHKKKPRGGLLTKNAKA